MAKGTSSNKRNPPKMWFSLWSPFRQSSKRRHPNNTHAQPHQLCTRRAEALSRGDANSGTPQSLKNSDWAPSFISQKSGGERRPPIHHIPDGHLASRCSWRFFRAICPFSDMISAVASFCRGAPSERASERASRCQTASRASCAPRFPTHDPASSQVLLFSKNAWHNKKTQGFHTPTPPQPHSRPPIGCVLWHVSLGPASQGRRPPPGAPTSSPKSMFSSLTSPPRHVGVPHPS